MAKCEVCGEANAVRVCSRCHRLICSNCTDATWGVCIECASVKRAIQQDYLRYLEKISCSIPTLNEKVGEESCFQCEILRDALMRYLKAVKDLEVYGKAEGFEGLVEESREVRRKLEDVAIKYFTRLILSLDREGFKKRS